MFTRRSFVFGFPTACLLGCTPAEVAFPPSTKLIVVRHADRTGDDLNDKGRARAQALVGALDGVHIDRIYSPGMIRNLDTAAPLARARGLEITRHPTTNVAQGILPQNAGKTVIWIGNKPNLREIWTSLAAPGEPPLIYGEMAILELGRMGRPAVTRRRFGAELDG